MCMFCAAIPAAAAVGAKMNNDQSQRRRQIPTADGHAAKEKPVIKITAGVVVLLLAGSITYHTLTFGP
jgi:hypothetical protein